MRIKIRCTNPECQAVVLADESMSGKTAACPKCGHKLVIQPIAETVRTSDTSERSTEKAASRTKEADQKGKTSARTTHVGRFEVRKRIGVGAFGTVYRAYDPVLNREVALKVPRAAAMANPKVRARFLREPKAVAQLQHPNIVPVYDAGVEGNRYYIASAFIEGRTLDEVMEDEQLDFRQTTEIVSKLALALDYAHRQGVVHRDVKPSNVMLDQQGQPMLVDFGLAQVEGSDEKLTQDGSWMGTPAYMAPEQANSDIGEVGPASDQYSLGVVLYQFLAGETPFIGPPAVQICNIASQEPPRPRDHRPDVPQDLETICLKAMSKEPGKRYDSCGSLSDDLRRWLAGKPICARRVSRLERLRLWRRRNPMAFLSTSAAAFLLVTAITAGIALLLSNGGPLSYSPFSWPETFTNSLGMEFQRIPSGEFMMGSPEYETNRFAGETPQHAVQIAKPFYLGVHEVTQEQYKEVMGNLPSVTGPTIDTIRPSQYENEDGNFPPLEGPSIPVWCVSYEDALGFCRRLSEKEDYLYRLPTEAEWEYACRAGTKTVWSCGDHELAVSEYAWIRSNSGGGPHPVGQKRPNAWGLHDMCGNVEEWCSDWYDDSYYSKSPAADPTGPDSGTCHVLRGGAWHLDESYCRSSARGFDGSGAWPSLFGFRVVLDAGSSTAAEQSPVPRSNPDSEAMASTKLGRVSVRLKLEEGVELRQDEVVLRSADSSSSYRLKMIQQNGNEQLWSSDEVEAGFYRVALPSQGRYISPRLHTTVKPGETSELEMQLTCQRKVVFEWWYREDRNTNDWHSGSQELNTGDSWGPSRNGGYMPVFRIALQNHGTVELSPTNSTGAPLVGFDGIAASKFFSNEPFSSKARSVTEGGVFAFRLGGRRHMRQDGPLEEVVPNIVIRINGVRKTTPPESRQSHTDVDDAQTPSIHAAGRSTALKIPDDTQARLARLESHAQRCRMILKEALSAGDFLGAHLALQALRNRYADTKCVQQARGELSRHESIIKPHITLDNVEDHTEYFIVPPDKNSPDWIAAIKNAKRSKGTIILLRICLEDPTEEDAVLLRGGRTIRQINSEYRGYPATSVVRNGWFAFCEMSGRGYSPAEQYIQVQTMYHRSPKIPLKIVDGDVIPIGDVVLRFVPRTERGRVAVHVNPEQGLELKQEMLQLELYASLSSSMVKIQGESGESAWLSDWLCPNRYGLELASHERCIGPRMDVTVEPGEMIEVDLPLHFQRKVALEWWYRNDHDSNDWNAGSEELLTGNMLQIPVGAHRKVSVGKFLRWADGGCQLDPYCGAIRLEEFSGIEDFEFPAPVMVSSRGSSFSARDNLPISEGDALAFEKRETVIVDGIRERQIVIRINSIRKVEP